MQQDATKLPPEILQKAAQQLFDAAVARWQQSDVNLLNSLHQGVLAACNWAPPKPLTFAEVLPDFLAGKVLRRKGWGEGVTVKLGHDDVQFRGRNGEVVKHFSLNAYDFCGADWEVHGG